MFSTERIFNQCYTMYSTLKQVGYMKSMRMFKKRICNVMGLQRCFGVELCKYIYIYLHMMSSVPAYIVCPALLSVRIREMIGSFIGSHCHGRQPREALI